MTIGFSVASGLFATNAARGWNYGQFTLVAGENWLRNISLLRQPTNSI